ncbi:MAG: prepilin-type N-terminal cleavage/methylation domain-containing protein [Kiritimatiellia bacterium]
MNAKGRRIHAAFSLVELLATVAIILILLSLLLPLTGLVRQRAETARCLSNLRQVMAATNVYTSEHDGFYPSPWRWVWSDGSSGLWAEWAQANTIPDGTMWKGGYITTREVYLCSSFKRVYGLNPAFSHLTPYVGYSMNEFMASEENLGGSDWAGRPKLKRAQIEKPGALGVFGDEGTMPLPWGPVVINNLCLGVGDNRSPGNYCDALAAFHNMPGNDPTKGKGNVAFADGHAALSISQDSIAIFTPSQYK